MCVVFTLPFHISSFLIKKIPWYSQFSDKANRSAVICTNVSCIPKAAFIQKKTFNINMILCIPFKTLFLLWYVGKEMSIHSTYFQRRLHQPDCSGRWQKPVYVKSRSTTWGPQPARLRSVTHTASPRSPTVCQWHGKVCLTRLPVTHFLSQPCTCTPLGDVMAGFPFGVALLSTLPIWHNVRMHACVFMCVHPSACLAQTSVSGTCSECGPS